MLVAFNNLAELPSGGFWLPPQSSSYAQDIDWLFWFIMAICVIFFLLVAVLVVVFCWKYRYREGAPVYNAPKHNTALELTWTFVPTVLVIIIFIYGFKGYLRMTVKPPNTYEIVVQGQMWHWNFQYPNGGQSDELHVPQGVPVEYVLMSSDVIHGFYVPAFRVKKDVVPGRYNRIWAQADEAGTFNIFCTQYCGDQHSMMRTFIHVDTPAAFNEFLTKITSNTLPPVEHGAKLYTQKGCNTCHSINGDKGTGPTWKNLYGHEVRFSDGNPPLIADENYIHSMIAMPNNKIVEGFQGVMPPVQLMMKERTHDIDDLVAYIRTLSDMYHPTTLPTTLPTTAPTTAPIPVPPPVAQPAARGIPARTIPPAG